MQMYMTYHHVHLICFEVIKLYSGSSRSNDILYERIYCNDHFQFIIITIYKLQRHNITQIQNCISINRQSSTEVSQKLDSKLTCCEIYSTFCSRDLTGFICVYIILT
jgi:hypothetical protein